MSERIARHYRQLFEHHGDTPAAAQYSSRESQEARFAVLCEVGDLTGRTLLDFGCGTGHLASYLKRRGISHGGYTGIDLVPELLSVARAKHPEHEFRLSSSDIDDQYDYALVSGVFNNRRRDNRRFYQSVVRDLYDRCRIGVAFNMLSTYVDYRDGHLFYEDPARVLSFLKLKISSLVTIRHDYRIKQSVIPFEFTAYVYRSTPQPGA